jgi:23S rRNA pseudouridine1911/1915/1917 synthase
MAPRIAWTHAADAEPERLDTALAGQAEWLSRSIAQKAIREGLVTVNGAVARRPSHPLEPGDEVVAEAHGPADAPGAANPDIPLSIVYEDEHIVVVDKPAGLSVHPGSGHIDDTLVNGLLARFPQMALAGPADRPGVAHRLDRDTSGLLIFALTEEALERLGQMMRKREVSRTYIALVHGHIKPPEGTVDAPIGRDPANRTRQAIVDSGKPARTRYRLVETIGGASLLEVRLETGRMHQIRVHLAAIGYPVLGDPAYGRAPKVEGLSRQFLHAARLEFSHPVTGHEMKLESPLPEDLRVVLERLRNQG